MSLQPVGPAGRVRDVPRAAWHGLVRVLVGADRPLPWPPDRLRWLKWLTRIALVVVTAVLYPVTMVTTLEGHHTRSAVVGLLAVAQLVPLALILRWPLLGWRIAFLVALLGPNFDRTNAWGNWPWDPVQVPVLGAVFVVAGLRHGRAALWWMYALMVGLALLWVDGTDVVGAAVLLTVVTALVDAIGSRLRAQRALEAETERTELEKARRAVLEERARIARELHDVVAHHMSLIAVQAETARYRRTDVTEGAAEEFASIGAQAREALADMRRLLGVLRSEETAMRAPQPALRDLDELVDGLRRAGADVTMAMDVAEPAPPEPVQVCAYRVVQEALSNATRHAPGAPIAVEVTGTAGELRIAVRNGPADRPATAGGGSRRASADDRTGGADGGPGRADAGDRADGGGGSGRASAGHHAGGGGSGLAGVREGAGGVGDRAGGVGHGLVGMRERVALLGGTLEAGPVPGGYRVAATLPVPRAESAPGDDTTV